MRLNATWVIYSNTARSEQILNTDYLQEVSQIQYIGMMPIGTRLEQLYIRVTSLEQLSLAEFSGE